MGQVALNVAIQIDPEAREAVLSALLDHRERCLREEPGTAQFEVMVPEEDPTRLFLFELYRDAEALQAHASGESITRYRAEVKGRIQSVQVTRCLLGHEAPGSAPRS